MFSMLSRSCNIHFRDEKRGRSGLEEKSEIVPNRLYPIHQLFEIAGKGNLFDGGSDLSFFHEKTLGPHGEIARDGIGCVNADQLGDENTSVHFFKEILERRVPRLDVKIGGPDLGRTLDPFADTGAGGIPPQTVAVFSVGQDLLKNPLLHHRRLSFGNPFSVKWK